MNSSIISTDYELSTNKSLANITFTDNDIGKIIRELERNKAYVHDMMSTCMLKICGDFVYKPLGLIFRACLDHEMFPQNWKKVNVLLIHIKNEKQLIKNYIPISFFNILENKMFFFFLY